MLRVVCQQSEPRVGRPDEDRQLATSSVKVALDLGADLIVLPELVTSGYVFQADSEVSSAALTRDASVFEDWRQLVAPTDAIVVAGFAELGEDGRFYNSAVVVGGDGVLAIYRKAHLWDEEKRWFTRGDDPPPVVQTRWGRMGVLVCYDVEFPETVRDLVVRGAEIIAVPTNWPVFPFPEGERPAEIANAMVAARLSRVYIACCDRSGSERGVDWTGGSCIIDPDGWLLAERVQRDQGPVVAEIDVALARDKTVGQRNDVLADRRPELYGSLVRRTKGI